MKTSIKYIIRKINRLRRFNPQEYWDKRTTYSKKPGAPKISEAKILLSKNSILDIGCGPGIDFETIKPNSAIDFSRNQLEKITNRDVDLIHADASNLPFIDNSFEAIFIDKVLLHIPYDKIDQTRREIIRVFSKILVLNEPINVHDTQARHCFTHDQFFGFRKLLPNSPIYQTKTGLTVIEK